MKKTTRTKKTPPTPASTRPPEKAIGTLVQRNMLVRVTEEDIRRAKASDSMQCVVAQAIARTVKDAHHIEVDSQTIRFTDGAARFHYPTPPVVQGYVVAFDAGDEIRPFAFRLQIARRIRAQRVVKSPGRKLVERAASRARNRAKRRGAPTVDVKTAYRLAYAEAKTALPEGTLVSETRDAAASAEIRPPTPRMFKRSRGRHYGGRQMRVNQDPAPRSWEDVQAAVGVLPTE